MVPHPSQVDERLQTHLRFWLELPDHSFAVGVFRCSTSPTASDDPGVWLQRDGPRVLDDGPVPVYLHDAPDVASARTADASGFPDEGWRIVGLFGADPEAP